jgi:exonuclease SbcC
MIIGKLNLRNFMGYRDPCELDFSGRKTIGIVGQNESGKSTILQAISYALYGKTLAEREVQLISDGATADMVVECEVLLPDGRSLEITRGRNRSNSPIIKLAGAQGKATDVAAMVQEELRLAYQDFISLTYFVQGDLHQFMEGNKREYFQRWTRGLARWRTFEDQAKQAAHQLEKARQARIIERQAAEEVWATRKDAQRCLDEAKESVQRLEASVEDARQYYLQCQMKVDAHKMGADLKDTMKVLANQARDLNRQLVRADQEVNNLRRELKQISGGRCPLLDIDCEDLKLAGQNQKANAEFKLAEAKRNQDAIEKQFRANEARLAKVERKAAADPIHKLKQKLDNAKYELAACEKDLKTAQATLARSEMSLETIKEAKRKLDSLKGDDAALETDLRQWRFVQFMCSKDGVPSMLIEQELARVEERCNWVLERLEYPKRIRFSGYRELQSFERVCPLCGGEKWHKQICSGCGATRPRKRQNDPTITILQGEHERPFALESGGAKVLQSFAVRLAGSLFHAAMTGIPFKMIMLDEVFGMLDATNRQKLMTLVIDKLASEFGLAQQFVVSHQEDVINAVDDLLVITKERGSSKAQWA